MYNKHVSDSEFGGNQKLKEVQEYTRKRSWVAIGVGRGRGEKAAGAGGDLHGAGTVLCCGVG